MMIVSKVAFACPNWFQNCVDIDLFLLLELERKRERIYLLRPTYVSPPLCYGRCGSLQFSWSITFRRSSVPRKGEALRDWHSPNCGNWNPRVPGGVPYSNQWYERWKQPFPLFHLWWELEKSFVVYISLEMPQYPCQTRGNWKNDRWQNNQNRTSTSLTFEAIYDLSHSLSLSLFLKFKKKTQCRRFRIIKTTRHSATFQKKKRNHQGRRMDFGRCN